MVFLVDLCMEVLRLVERWSGKKKKCWWKNTGNPLEIHLQLLPWKIRKILEKLCKNHQNQTY